MAPGDYYESNHYGAMRVVEYKNAKDVTVEFVDTGHTVKTYAQCIRAGLVVDAEFRRLVANERRIEARARVMQQTPDDMKPGTVHTMKDGTRLQIAEFRSAREVVAIIQGAYVLAPSAMVRAGTVRNPFRALDKRKDSEEILREAAGKRFRYEPETGALYRQQHVGAASGRMGSATTYGKRQATVGGVRFNTDHIVWFMETGHLPAGNLRHENGDNSDDRFANLRHEPAPVRILDGYEPEQPPETFEAALEAARARMAAERSG